jgi:UDP-glucose 4-epimerase
MKILVTGGAGFIGSHVVDRYVSRGHQVVVVDNFSTGRPEYVNRSATLYRVDIRSPRLMEIFEKERPELLNHHAAQMDLRRSVADPSFDAQVNILGSLNLLECCRRSGVGRVIFASTGGAVYGDMASPPTPEDHPTRPASPYGISKLAVEHYLACWEALYGIRGLALRYANVYGPRQTPKGEAGVVAIFTHRLLAGTEALINGDGEQTRDYVYVDDVAEANLRALERPDLSGAVNIGTGVETSVNELFRRITLAAGVTGAARHGPPKLGEQRRSALDSGLAKRLLGWTPQVSLDEGLRRTAEHIRQGERT